jgi:hypothetical protein
MNRIRPAFAVWLCILLAGSLLLAQAGGELTSVVKNIPGQIGEGKEVTIIGYYRGWDLLREVNLPPPVTRSDWVIADKSGAIYVEARNVEIKGREKMGGQLLNPNQKESTTHILRVIGIVRLTVKKQPYIEPSIIELLK